jgi:glycosyltransferase involved in cell wall biosynthesis
VRLLTVANDLAPFGGLERSQLDVVGGLAARGHQVHLVHTREGSLTDAWDEVATTRTRAASTQVRPGAPRRSAQAVATLTRRVRDVEPDVIYVHHYRHLHALLPSMRRSSIPIVLHLHSAAPTRLGRVGRRAARLPARVIAVSAHTAQVWKPFLGAVDVVHNGIDLDGTRPAPDSVRHAARNRLGIDANCFVAGFAARLTPEKGLETLLVAWRTLAPELGERCLLIAGSGHPDVERELRAVAPPSARFLGFIDDLTDVYAAADVMVVPSVWPDPCPRAVIEALAAGDPVVGSAIGGIPELLPPEPAGAAVTPGAADELAVCLAEHATARDDRRRRRALAREHAEREFDLDRALDRVETILGEAVRDRTQPKEST